MFDHLKKFDNRTETRPDQMQPGDFMPEADWPRITRLARRLDLLKGDETLKTVVASRPGNTHIMDVYFRNWWLGPSLLDRLEWALRERDPEHFRLYGDEERLLALDRNALISERELAKTELAEAKTEYNREVTALYAKLNAAKVRLQHAVRTIKVYDAIVKISKLPPEPIVLNSGLKEDD